MLKSKIDETCGFLQERITDKPRLGIILGSGLALLREQVEDATAIPYDQIPNFPISTVEGHGKELIFGTLGGKSVMLLSGRFHYYEGYTMDQVTFPVRIMRALGCEYMVVSNASGGLHPDFRVGDVMIIRDHINLFPEHPLHGPNDDSLGPRFPDMSEPYSYDFIKKTKSIADQENIALHEGVYVGVQGPTFETRAEYKYLRLIGGDAVGMSTVPEVIVGVHSGLKIMGLSVITDVGIREELNTITHDEVLEAAAEATPKVSLLVSRFVQSL